VEPRSQTQREELTTSVALDRPCQLLARKITPDKQGLVLSEAGLLREKARIFGFFASVFRVENDPGG
jgi:hypothetical protein